MMNSVGWFEIYVSDMERAKQFYQGVFQVELLKLASEVELWGFPMDEKQYGAGGALAKMDGMSPGAGGSLMYFNCDDCAVESARVATFGGKVIKEKWAIGNNGFIAIVQDTEGNILGLHSRQ